MDRLGRIKKLLDDDKNKESDFKKMLLHETRKDIELFIEDSVKHMLDSGVRSLVMGFPLGMPTKFYDSYEHYPNYVERCEAVILNLEEIYTYHDLTEWYCERLSIENNTYLEIITDSVVKQMIDDSLTTLGAEFETHKGFVAYREHRDAEYGPMTTVIDRDEIDLATVIDEDEIDNEEE